MNISNAEIDKMWFKMLIKQGFTCDEIASKECVWIAGEEIAELVGIDYKRDEAPEPSPFAFMEMRV